MAKTTDFAQAIRAELANDPDLLDAVEHERFCADLASQLVEARTKAKLTQQQLAQRAKTHQSVVARLEDADYRGHSLRMLRRLARALGMRLSVSLKPSSDQSSTDEVAEVIDVPYPVRLEGVSQTSDLQVPADRRRIFRICPVATLGATPGNTESIQKAIK